MYCKPVGVRTLHHISTVITFSENTWGYTHVGTVVIHKSYINVVFFFILFRNVYAPSMQEPLGKVLWKSKCIVTPAFYAA